MHSDHSSFFLKKIFQFFIKLTEKETAHFTHATVPTPAKAIADQTMQRRQLEAVREEMDAERP